MTSMFGDYIKEREGKEILESDLGFATYFYLGNQCYIQDIYVKPEARKSKEATRLANEISRIAKDKGCKTLVGTVMPSANGSTESLKVLLSYGFKLDSCTTNLIALTKEIGE